MWFTCLSLGLTTALIIYPEDALTASLRGLDLWWEVVFPSLLPFFVTAELLIGFGVVHGLGTVSEKFMRPLFNVPGSGGFVWVMGMASGYPAGAKWTADLRRNGEVTRIEAERMVAFTNSSSPLFIFGAVSVGFFHDASLGVLLAIAHYGGNFIIGIIMRFYRRNEDPETRDSPPKTWRHAFKTIHQSRIKDGRSVGKLMGDAVSRSVDTLLMVGGFIMLFSVLTELMKSTGVIHFFSSLLALAGMPDNFHIPLTAGILEVTTGIGAITDTQSSLLAQLMLVSFILGFHGFSIQAQIASILAQTDIRFKPYAIARLAHGAIATLLTVILYHYYLPTPTAQQVMHTTWSKAETFTTPVLDYFSHYGPPLTLTMILAMIIVKWTRGHKWMTNNNNNHSEWPS